MVNTKGIAAAFFYGSMSITLVFVNKFILTMYQFKYNGVLVLAQMIVTLFILHALQLVGLTKVSFSWETAKKVYPLSLCYVANAIVSFVALRLVNIPMFGALRRLTAVFVMVAEYTVLHKTQPPSIITAICVMVLGSMVAGLNDITYDPFGYFMTFMNNVFTALYLTLVKYYSKHTSLNTFEQMYYNTVLAFIPMTFYILIAGEGDVVEYIYWHDTNFLIAFITSCIQAFFLNYAMFLCTTLNSPLTTSTTGQMTKIVSLVAGLFVLSEKNYSPLYLFGLFSGLAGSLVYSYLQFGIEQRKKQEQPGSKV